MLTINYDPMLISPLRAYAQVKLDIAYILEMFSLMDGVVYSIATCEPSHSDVPMTVGLGLNDNQSVEIERFFGNRVYQVGTTAETLLTKVDVEAAQYKKECDAVAPNTNIYTFLRSHFQGQVTSAGYPQFFVVLGRRSMKDHPNIFNPISHYEKYFTDHNKRPYLQVQTVFKGRHTSSYQRESTAHNRAENDVQILAHIFKNVTKSEHSNLIGCFPIFTQSIPERVSILMQTLNQRFGFQIVVDAPHTEPLRQIVIGGGRAPPPSTLPIIPASESKFHGCLIIICQYMRKHMIYIDITTAIFYHRVSGSNQTYKYWNDGTPKTFLEGLLAESPREADVIRSNYKFIIESIHPQQKFFDAIEMNYKWIEYGDFCLNLSSGITTPKDGRYACFRCFPDVKLGDGSWTAETVPKLWFGLLYALGAVEYDPGKPGTTYLRAKGDLLNILYEVLVPRYTKRRNLSFADASIFRVLLGPLIGLYDKTAAFDASNPFDKTLYDAAQVAVFDKFQPSARFGIKQIYDATVNPNESGTRSILVDNFDKTLGYPEWAMKEESISAYYMSAFKQVFISEDAAKPEFRRHFAQFANFVLVESGQIVRHLAINYFLSMGGIYHIEEPSQIDMYSRSERAAEFMTQSSIPQQRPISVEDIFPSIPARIEK